MKKNYILILIAVISTISISMAINNKSKKQEFIPIEKSTVFDHDFLKNEMRESVMEFIEETGINPDSCYIP